MEHNMQMDMRQTQKLILSPQIEQSLTVLKMGSDDLEEAVEEELLVNPVLTVSDSYYSWNPKRYSIDQTDYINAIPDKSDENLCSFLLLQLHTYKGSLSKRLIRIGEYLIYSLDDKGFLPMKTDELVHQLSESEDNISTMLSLIKTFEPVGVGAYDLTECLLRQTESDETRILIQNHLQDVAMNNIVLVRQETGFSIEVIRDCIKEIKSMKPIPSRGFASARTNRYVTPDVEVKVRNNTYDVIWFKRKSGHIILDNRYLALTNAVNKDKGQKDQINQYLSNANHFLKAIHNREIMLDRLMKKIVERQSEFFEKGSLYLSPLSMAEMAEELEVHESTVSRAVANKYIECRWGMYEMKYFFSNKIKKHSSQKAYSMNPVETMKYLIKSEDKSSPLSDESLSKAMKKMGINISRRTVTKYREQQKIPSSKARKTW